MTVGSVDIRAISTPYTQILEKLEKDQPLDDDEVIYGSSAPCVSYGQRVIKLFMF